MNARRRFLARLAALPALGLPALGLPALAPPGAARAQGYGGLGAGGEGFAPVTPGRDFAFPADHAPHPGHRIEWWYVTANLETPQGAPLGVQWTLFRQAVAPGGEAGAEAGGGWSAPQLWMGHAALTTPERHLSAEKFARGGVGQAGVGTPPFRAWIDDWRLEGPEPGLSPLRLRAGGEGFAYDLALEARGPLVLQGEGGYSRKSEDGQASYYYSQPFYAASGEVRMGEGDEALPVSGRAWLDREWSSQPLQAEQEGWDWFSLHLPGGAKLMLYRMRRRDGAHYHASSWISPQGRAEALDGAGVEMTPLERTRTAGRDVPTAWRIALPERGLRLRAEALNPHCWMDAAFPYWEGPVRFSGTHEGVGYLEMTGYGPPAP